VPTPPGVTVLPTPIYETVLMCLLAWGLWQIRDRVRPGVVFALYLVGSGFERFMIEFIRRNSEVALGLTTPQLESVIAMAAGLIWLGVLVHRGGLESLRADGPARGQPAKRAVTA
jgi:phosphatidylglycerol:prolipoprotein diacylglycerol transferase